MNFKTDKAKTMERVNEHLAHFRSKYPDREWVGIFLVGSQNYDLATEESDIDTRIFVVPSFEDVALNRAPVSITLGLPNNEFCDVKDIRLAFEGIKKQGINSLEVLFTDYKVVNEKYQQLFEPMFANRETIARYDEKLFVRAVSGVAYNCHKRLVKSFDEKTHTLEGQDNSYDAKSFIRIVRCLEAIRAYSWGFNFDQVLKTTQAFKPSLFKAKQHVLPKDYVCNNAEEMMREINDFRNKMFSLADNRANKAPVDTVMHKVLLDIFKKSFEEVFNNA